MGRLDGDVGGVWFDWGGSFGMVLMKGVQGSGSIGMLCAINVDRAGKDKQRSG
jgi:hypothetical protein